MNDNQDVDKAIDFGIVRISVANIRSKPSFQSELTNQTLLGTIVTVFEEQNDFCYILNRDGYRGWVSKHSLVRMDKAGAQAWQSAPRVMVVGNYGVVRKQMDEESDILTDLVPCVVLKKIGTHSHFVQVELPDGHTGFVKDHLVIDEEQHHQIHITPKAIVRVAKSFLGVPYLWGGTSAKGFDCSGFVQTVFRLLNKELPRDSGPMSRTGEEIDITDIHNLRTGDLLFFGKSPQQINHVAIYMGDGLYIHSRGMVGINSLHAEHPLYNEYLHRLWVKATRVI